MAEVTDGRWQMAGGGWQMAVADGRWQMAVAEDIYLASQTVF
jgi:hypothetical protein